MLRHASLANQDDKHAKLEEERAKMKARVIKDVVSLQRYGLQ